MDIDKQIAVLDNQIKLHQGAMLGLEEAKNLLLAQHQALKAVEAAKAAVEQPKEG